MPMRRFRRTPGRSDWQTSRVGIKSGATGLNDEAGSAAGHVYVPRTWQVLRQ
jgi:hypothetical protein